MSEQVRRSAAGDRHLRSAYERICACGCSFVFRLTFQPWKVASYEDEAVPGADIGLVRLERDICRARSLLDCVACERRSGRGRIRLSQSRIGCCGQGARATGRHLRRGMPWPRNRLRHCNLVSRVAARIGGGARSCIEERRIAVASNTGFQDACRRIHIAWTAGTANAFPSRLCRGLRPHRASADLELPFSGTGRSRVPFAIGWSDT